MPRTRGGVEHLRACVCVHGEVGHRVGHGVMRARGGSSGARQVGPLAVALRVEAEEPGILGRSVLTELAKDMRSVANNLDVGSAVSRRCLESRNQPGEPRLVGGPTDLHFVTFSSATVALKDY
jgi:hypothetical protein